MVGHEHPTVDATVEPVVQPMSVCRDILVGSKQSLAIVAALNDMNRNTGRAESRASQHQDYVWISQRLMVRYPDQVQQRPSAHPLVSQPSQFQCVYADPLP